MVGGVEGRGRGGQGQRRRQSREGPAEAGISGIKHSPGRSVSHRCEPEPVCLLLYSPRATNGFCRFKRLKRKKKKSKAE